MKVLTTVRNIAVLITELLYERRLPFSGMPKHEHIFKHVNTTEIFRVAPRVSCLPRQTVNSSAGKLDLKLVMT